ncbi:MAG: MraY family glycosyltransferase, partial [candidate division Zixibacteria bacterium]|nr:MraY family glycosyltransferase [candidate division Zixibacteria bacterium]
MDIVIYPLAFLFSAGIAFVLVRGIIRLCHRFAFYDYPGSHKSHKNPTPNLGGVAIFLAVWSIIGISLLARIETIVDIRGNLTYIFAASLLLLLTGIIDDLKSLSAWPKLLIQIIAGLVLYFGGLSIKIVSIPGTGSVELGNLSMIITVLWVVSLTNAVNLIDGLDGLAAGVSIIAAISMTIIGTLFHIGSVIFISLTLAGALLAFWIHNRYPAKIFLGDCGSLLIGFFFAVISLIVPIKSFTVAALLLPLVVLAVPLTEIATSFFRRLASGKNVMQADHRHIFHYLEQIGLSQRKIVNLFYLMGTFFGLISVGMFFIERSFALTILLLFMVVIFAIYLIFISKILKG